jgi:hypothetical protein
VDFLYLLKCAVYIDFQEVTNVTTFYVIKLRFIVLCQNHMSLFFSIPTVNTMGVGGGGGYVL